MKVLVIPEDFRKDQYVLKPIIEAMFAEIGCHARVIVCQDPLLGGISEALKKENLALVFDRYQGMIDLFLLVVDRDGLPGRRDALDERECWAKGILPGNVLLLGENAWQEVEVWALAGHDLPNEWTWADVRTDANSKEQYFTPFARSRGLQSAPYEGRGVLAKEAAGRYRRIRQLCPEDVGALERRVRTFAQRA